MTDCRATRKIRKIYQHYIKVGADRLLEYLLEKAIFTARKPAFTEHIPADLPNTA